MKRQFAIGALMVALLSLSSFAGAQTTFIARLTGAQETPPTTSSASGLAILTLDSTHTQLSYDLVVTGLINIVAAHIHNGAPGVAGPVIYPIASAPFTHLSGLQAITPADVSNLQSGNLYLNVHTQANPGGEIRGQIVRPPAGTFYVKLTGPGEVPATTSTAVALGLFTLDSANANVTYDLITSPDLSTPIIAAHLHNGPIGMVGPVIIPLASAPFSELTGTAPIAADQVAALQAGNVYANIHTTTNPGGEIRGELSAALSDMIPPTPPASEFSWQLPITITSSVADASQGLGMTIGTDPKASDGYGTAQITYNNKTTGEDLQGPGRPPSHFATIVEVHTSNEPGWTVTAPNGNTVPHGGLYTQDIRFPVAPGSSKTWDKITVSSDLGSVASPAQIVLSWPNLTNISPALKFTLIDRSNAIGGGINSTYDMRDPMLGNQIHFQQATTPTMPINNYQFAVMVSNVRTPPAPVVSGVTVSNLTSAGFTVTFNTDVATTAMLNYGTAAGQLTQTLSDATAGTTHTFNVPNLTAGTPYFFQAVASAPGLTQPGTSPVTMATTFNVLNAVGNVAVSNLSPIGATLTFKTSGPSTAVVSYGTDPNKLTSMVNLSTAAATQVANLTGLTVNTPYFVKVVSSAPGAADLVQTLQVNTPSDLVVGTPKVDNIASATAQVTVTTSTPTTATLSYGTPDLKNPKTVTDATSGTTHVFKLTGLTAGAVYMVQAAATPTIMGFTAATSGAASFTTLKPINLVSGPTVTATSNSLTFTYTTDVPSTGVINFGPTTAYGSSRHILVPATAQTVTISGLKAGTAYHYQLIVSNPGTSSVTTADATITTLPAQGDVDGDGTFDLSDVQLVLAYVIGMKTLTPDELKRADVAPVGAPDGVVDLRDVSHLLRFLDGIDPTL